MEIDDVLYWAMLILPHSISSFGATLDSHDIVVYTTHDLSEYPYMLYTELCVALATFVLHMT